MRAISVAAICLLLPSCVFHSGAKARVDKLPHFPQAAALPATYEAPRLVKQGEDDLSALPVGTEYFRMGKLSSSENAVRREFFKKGKEFGADIITYKEADPVSVGAVGVYHGFGVSSASNVMQRQWHGWGYRLQRSRIGVHLDSNEVVIGIADDSNLSGVGVQEGDQLISLNNRPFDDPDQTGRPAVIQLMGIEPGTELKLIWLSRGDRHESMVATIPNLDPASFTAGVYEEKHGPDMSYIEKQQAALQGR